MDAPLFFVATRSSAVSVLVAPCRFWLILVILIEAVSDKKYSEIIPVVVCGLLPAWWHLQALVPNSTLVQRRTIISFENVRRCRIALCAWQKEIRHATSRDRNTQTRTETASTRYGLPYMKSKYRTSGAHDYFMWCLGEKPETNELSAECRKKDPWGPMKSQTKWLWHNSKSWAIKIYVGHVPHFISRRACSITPAPSSRLFLPIWILGVDTSSHDTKSSSIMRSPPFTTYSSLQPNSKSGVPEKYFGHVPHFLSQRPFSITSFPSDYDLWCWYFVPSHLVIEYHDISLHSYFRATEFQKWGFSKYFGHVPHFPPQRPCSITDFDLGCWCFVPSQRFIEHHVISHFKKPSLANARKQQGSPFLIKLQPWCFAPFPSYSPCACQHY